MNPQRWILLAAVALLCYAQVWGKPTDKDPDEDNYPEDDGDLEAKEDDDYDESDLITAPVELLTQPQVIRAADGDDVVLPCELKNAGEGMVSWKRDLELLVGLGTKMTRDQRIEYLPNNSLLIRHVRLNDSSSEYTCEAVATINKKVVHQLIVSPRGETNAAGLGGGEGNEDDLVVRVLPEERLDIDDGSNVTLGCEATGNVASIRTIFWSRGGQRIKSSYNNSRGIYLQIHNANRHLAGDYQCLVETGQPKPITKHIELKVKHVPQIEYEKERVGERLRERITYYTGIGTDTNITCVVHSHPPVRKINWFKHDNAGGSASHKLKIDDSHLSKSDEHRSHHVLTIRKTQKSDLGVYSCKAWNDLGEAVGPQIKVRDTPDQPLFKKGTTVDDSIVFQWRVNSYKPVVEAELLYRKDGEENWRRSDNARVVSSNGKEHVIEGSITGIEAGKHEAMLRARNDEEHDDGDDLSEWGPYSELKKFDGEYKADTEAESVRGSALSPTVSLMTLLLFMLPLAYLHL